MVGDRIIANNIFTWLMTAIGAAMVFFFKSFNRKMLDAMLGFAAGVMIAASFWSLLAPAIEMAEISGSSSPMDQKENDATGTSTTWKRSVLLITAITLHNAPEGLAVGVAFGTGNSQGWLNRSLGSSGPLRISPASIRAISSMIVIFSASWFIASSALEDI